jgi:hypothetical protein
MSPTSSSSSSSSSSTSTITPDNLPPIVSEIPETTINKLEEIVNKFESVKYPEGGIKPFLVNPKSFRNISEEN